MKKLFAGAGAVSLALGLSACHHGTSQGQRMEFKQQSDDTTSLVANQPLPRFNFSQIRQNVIDLEAAQARGVETTSFFYNMGSNEPVASCPSIGAPIPTTTQISNPNQVIPDTSPQINNGGGNTVVGQMDPNGVYSGDSTGTYVMCVNAQGAQYAFYWEGYVATVFGAARLNPTTHQIELVGPPSFTFRSTKGK